MTADAAMRSNQKKLVLCGFITFWIIVIGMTIVGVLHPPMWAVLICIGLVLTVAFGFWGWALWRWT